MPFIEGTLLIDLLQNINHETAKSIFIRLINIINQTRLLSFPFSFNDLHEKNIIVDSSGNLHVIDCDGFVINNKVFKENDAIAYGKYLNNNVTTKNINSIDYICLLCMILKYLLKDKKVYNLNPIEFLEDMQVQNTTLNTLIERTKKDNFILEANDIDNLFNLDFSKLNSKPSVLKRVKNKIDIYKFKRLVTR